MNRMRPFQPFQVHWLRDAPTGLIFNNCTFCPHLYDLYVPRNKQRLAPLTAQTDWFLQPRRKMFTARYELGL